MLISSVSATVKIKWEITFIENLLPKKFGPQTWFINICFPQMHIKVIRTWWIGRLDFSLKLHCKKKRQFYLYFDQDKKLHFNKVLWLFKCNKQDYILMLLNLLLSFVKMWKRTKFDRLSWKFPTVCLMWMRMGKYLGKESFGTNIHGDFVMSMALRWSSELPSHHLSSYIIG